MPLVINSLGRGHTHMNTHIDDPHMINFKKPGTCQPAAGAHAWFNNNNNGNNKTSEV